MEIFKPYGKEYVYTEDELDRALETLVAAEEIRSNDKLYQAVTKHGEEKSGKITRIKDLRDLSAEGNSERKRL